MQPTARLITLAFGSWTIVYRLMAKYVTVSLLALGLWCLLCFGPLSSINNIAHGKSNATLNEKSVSNIGEHKYFVVFGDTLSGILNRYGITIEDINKVVSLDKDLSDLRVGQGLSWVSEIDGQLVHLEWDVSHIETRSYDRTQFDSFSLSKEIKESHWIKQSVGGTVSGNFDTSAIAAGLTRSEVNSAVKIINWEVDFQKLKNGDAFSILTLREVLDGEVEKSKLLGIHLYSQGKDIYAIRAEDGNFYNRSGVGFRKSFLRYPTEKVFRVSSGFSNSRLNPVTGRFAPHNGVDFAMPQGTPVLSVGDGKVLVARRSGTAGYYVAIGHFPSYTTRYMHLKKLLVKPGQKVKRGEIIGLSGNTGRSTGPHLHYEVWIKQKAVDPLTVKIPCKNSLKGLDREKYLSNLRETLPQLHFN